MTYLTKAQRKAVHRVFNRQPIMGENGKAISYREFRKTVQPAFDCVMVQWCGMYLGIELDGYTHS